MGAVFGRRGLLSTVPRMFYTPSLNSLPRGRNRSLYRHLSRPMSMPLHFIDALSSRKGDLPQEQSRSGTVRGKERLSPYVLQY